MCGSYYVCINGVATLMQCPGGLQYNVGYGVCSWPDPAGCNSVPATSGCDPAGYTNQGGLYPNSADCNKYFQCANGVAVARSCPAGMAFNPTSLICDWPSAVPGCSNSGEYRERVITTKICHNRLQQLEIDLENTCRLKQATKSLRLIIYSSIS